MRKAVLAGLAVATAGTAAIATGGLGAAPADLPDLKPLFPAPSAKANTRWVDATVQPGHLLYRFDSVIMNVGTGAFEVYRGADGATYQRVWAGGDPGEGGSSKAFPATAPAFEDVPIAGGAPGGPNALRYSAAFGHDHFHTQQIAAYDLLTTSGRPVAAASKNTAGFCLYDSWGQQSKLPPTRYPSQFSPADPACAHGETSYTGQLRMGIQRGWGDLYESQLADQWIDVTGVAPGVYQLRAVVNPAGLYREADASNNVAIDRSVVIPGVVAARRSATAAPGRSVRIRLSARIVGARVLSRRPGCPDQFTGRRSCMTRARPGRLRFAVSRPPRGAGRAVVRHGAVRYTPPAGGWGTVAFTYTAQDSRGLRSQGAPIVVRVRGGSRAFARAGNGLLTARRLASDAAGRLAAVQAKLDGTPAAPAPVAPTFIHLTARELKATRSLCLAALHQADVLEARLAGRPAPAPAAAAGSGGVARTLALAREAQRRAVALQRRV